MLANTSQQSYIRNIFAILAQERGMDELFKLLKENAVLPLWPETGRVLGLSRGATYAAAQSGDIKTIRFGRLLKVPTAWLRQKLDLVEPAA